MAILRPGDIIGPTLDKYHAQVTKDINAASKDAADKLTKKLKKTAPRNSGKYACSIGHTSRTSPATGATTYSVGAKGKQGRLTHLLANGHETRSGSRTRANPYLKNAVNEVLPEYEREVKQVIERGLIE